MRTVRREKVEDSVQELRDLKRRGFLRLPQQKAYRNHKDAILPTVLPDVGWRREPVVVELATGHLCKVVGQHAGIDEAKQTGDYVKEELLESFVLKASRLRGPYQLLPWQFAALLHVEPKEVEDQRDEGYDGEDDRGDEDQRVHPPLDATVDQEEDG